MSVRAPLQADQQYPPAWGDLFTLGPECTLLAGTYANDGVVTAPRATTLPISLTSLLNVPNHARTVTLNLRTREADRNGDTFVTLRVVTDGDAAATHELSGCFCIRQTLACTQVTEKYWTFPNFGFGGSQRNVYFSIASDRSLIARLQDYHADVILALPVFGIKEPWARFEAAERGILPDR